MITTHPLHSLSLVEAQQKQFMIIDVACQHFGGQEFLTLGDLGLVPGLNQPITTHKVEAVLAEIFQAEAAILVQGAGTGAIRCGLAAILQPGDTLLVHQAPLYPTTQTIVEQMGIQLLAVDFHHLADYRQSIQQAKPSAALVQHTRQQLSDGYQLADVVAELNTQQIPVVVDDNYAVMKVARIGCETGAELSTFSSFKLFGPHGVGVVVGKQRLVDKIRRTMYSGGCQIQGFQAMEVLRGLVLAPVMHAIQAEVIDEVAERLNQGELPAVKQAYIANAQSKVLLVEFDRPIATAILQQAEKRGALPYPVGAESKFEMLPLFYRVSSTFRRSDPELEQRMIRVNPNRSGAETVMRILRQSLEQLATEAAELPTNG